MTFLSEDQKESLRSQALSQVEQYSDEVVKQIRSIYAASLHRVFIFFLAIVVVLLATTPLIRVSHGQERIHRLISGRRKSGFEKTRSPRKAKAISRRLWSSQRLEVHAYHSTTGMLRKLHIRFSSMPRFGEGWRVATELSRAGRSVDKP